MSKKVTLWWDPMTECEACGSPNEEGSNIIRVGEKKGGILRVGIKRENELALCDRCLQPIRDELISMLDAIPEPEAEATND